MVPLALNFITTSELAIYLASIPLFVLILAKLILKEIITLKKWIGFFIGIIGLIILSEPHKFMIENFNELIASFICICISICLASGGIIIQKMPKCDPISFSASSFLIALIISLPIFFFLKPEEINFDKPLIGLLLAGILSTSLGGLARVLLIRRAGAVFTSNAITAPSSVSAMGAVITYSETGTNSLNTDIQLEFSANNGSNWTTATLTALPDFATDVKCAKVNDVSISNAGTALKYRLTYANQTGSKIAKVSGVSLQF